MGIGGGAGGGGAGGNAEGYRERGTPRTEPAGTYSSNPASVGVRARVGAGIT